ncbi:MAG: hypothetical protein IKB75_00635 [Clostridia bacterium]|nr:hypothetical protein [Clostridia bacterium]
MKNRLICLALCLVMILSAVLTGCGKKTDDDVKEDITEAASESALTLTMWVVSKEPVSAGVAKDVNDELNTISKSKFKTNLVVKFFTEDEYEAKLAETIIASQNAASAPGATEEPEQDDDAAVTDETRVNEYGWVEIVYPPERPNQVDIVYIAGEQMFDRFVANEWLAELDEELSGDSKKIKEYVSSTLLAAAKQEGVTYAIPNNNMIGEYTYMLLDKSLIDKYCQQGYVQQGLIDRFANEYLYDFLDQVQEFESDNGVIPVDATYEECLSMLAHYWNIDPETYDMLDGFSAFGYRYTDLEELSRGSVILGYQSLFANKDFAKDFLTLNRFRFDGYFGDAEASGKKAAVRFVKGDGNAVKQYEKDYYPVVVAYPTASVDDVYSNMFGIYSRTKNLGRAMEILTYLNTNAEFRNILQYGKEGLHYELVKQEDGSLVVERDKYNKYIMDIYATGNAFIAYPEPDMSQDIWESAKQQNRVSLVEPLLGFDFASFAASTGSTGNSIQVDSKIGYSVAYSTGYSKDVLSQNPELKAWLEASDAAGKNIYVFKSTQSSGQYLATEFYIYANQLSGGTVFTIGEEAVTQTTTTTDKKGNPVTTTKQVGVNLTFDYSDTQIAVAGRNYEIAKVTLYNRRSNYSTSITYTQNGAALEGVAITERAGFLNFSVYNTNEYSIEVYEGLTKAAIRFNENLLNWVSGCRESAGNSQTYVWRYQEAVDGKIVYTYVVLRNGLEYITDMEVVPTGDTGTLNLNFLFTDKGSKLDLSKDPKDPYDTREPSYILSYVRVTANENVAVDCSTSYRGFEEGEPVILKIEDAEADPDFLLLGELDTELVKFLYKLNTGVNEMIGACGNYFELEMVVADLAIMLSTENGIPKFESIQSDIVKNYIYSNKAEMQNPDGYMLNVYLRLLDAENMEKQEAPVDTDGNPVLYEDMEEYVCYYSPAAIYYAWLQTYGFLPKK